MRILHFIYFGIAALGTLALLAPGSLADSSGAANGGSAAQPVFNIQQMDKDVPVDQLAGPGVKIHKYGEGQGGWHLPTVAAREKAFYRAGLRPDIASWDQLDRDMLYLRARDTSVTDLSTQYPNLAKYKLKSLHKLLAKRNPAKIGNGSQSGSEQ